MTGLLLARLRLTVLRLHARLSSLSWLLTGLLSTALLTRLLSVWRLLFSGFLIIRLLTIRTLAWQLRRILRRIAGDLAIEFL